MAMQSLTAQRAVALKSLLLQAWRERWSDMQWSINMKKLLPIASSDNAQLAELLLQQALVGSSPNLLLLSYLRHALSTQMVSHSATLRHLVQFTDINKPYCLRSLLELIHGFAPKLSKRGNDEDSLSLARAMLHLWKWLYEVMYKSLQKLSENSQASEYYTVIMRACAITNVLLNDNAAKALLYIARLDESETFREIEQTSMNVRGSLGQMQNDIIPGQLRDALAKSLGLVESLSSIVPEQQKLLEVSDQPLNVSLNALLTQEAVLNPTNDIQSFAEQILIIEKLQGISRPELYCEMFRTCLLGIIDAAGGQDEIKWAAFAVLKLPQVLVRLTQTGGSKKPYDLEAGIQMLLTYTPLLDLADTKCSNCDTLNYLLHELGTKYSLLTEAQIKEFTTSRRFASSQKSKAAEQGAAQQSIGLILRAEPTVQSILKTLDTDYSRNQEALLGVLCHMLSGKSFELILAAAAATGRLQSFAVKLIKFNEFAKQTQGETGKAAQTRGLLFDITFLMLCHIMQLYGTDIISTSQEANGSFFVQWTSRCLPEDGKYKSLELLAPPDPIKVEQLLRQFNPNGELVTNLTKWHEVCHNAPYAVQEVLFAWEHGVLNNDKIKAIMDNVKGRMCCLPVVVSAWLCSYINTIDEDFRKKPRSMLQQLTKPIIPDAANQYYNERSHLMQIIQQRMIQGVLPRGLNRSTSCTLPTNRSAYQVLMETFRSCFKKGCVDLKAIHMFEHLISVGGAKWFCEHVVREVLSHSRLEDLRRGISLVYATFHMDLENLTLSLLHHTVPGLLHAAGSKLTLLTDPRGQMLAKLCAMCLVVLHRMRTMQKDSPGCRRGRKRTRAEIDVDEPEEEGDEDRPIKLRRLPVHDESLSLHSEGFNLGDLLSSREDAQPSPTYDPKDALNKTLVNLFRMFNGVVSQSKVCQKTGFVMSFIQEVINSGPQTARFVLQFMPPILVSQLMKCLPAEFSPGLLVSVCDLSTTQGRRVTTKVISQNAKWHQMQGVNVDHNTKH